MTDPLTRPLEILVAPEAPATKGPVLQLPTGVGTGEAITALHTFFAGHPETDLVRIEVSGALLGFSSRAHANWLRSNGQRGIGDGDGASLPHLSSGFQRLEYRCPTCNTPDWIVHVDVDGPPRCPEGHGVMEYQR